MVKVNVKWNKNSYDVDVDPADGLETLQASLFSLTNVPADRQKLMLKGRLLKSDADIAQLAADSKLLLMGTADSIAAAPAKAVLFEEDLSEKDRVALAPSTVTSAGLVNLGNTCYMNSTLQAFRHVPELKQALIRYGSRGAASGAGGGGGGDAEALVTSQLGRLMLELEHSGSSITPLMFTTVFRSSFAQFAERNNEGAWAQQDADECLQTLLQAMANKLGQYTPPAAASASPASSPSPLIGPVPAAPSPTPPSVIDYIFGGGLSVSTRCAESDAEAERRSVEPFRKLRCHIDNKISFLIDGLKADLESEMEMRSALLGRSAVWKKSSRIASLPRYLLVQFVRFDWKKDTQKKAKVLRKVEFPLRLDAAELCNPQLKRSLLHTRRLLKDEDDKTKGLSSLNRSANATVTNTSRQQRDKEEKKEAPPSASASASASAAMDVDVKEEEGGAEARPATTSGHYDLLSVITHKGRNADSGHYIGWCRASEQKDSDRWWKYDDDAVSEVNSDDIRQLSGGGDWHMAYLLVYKLDEDAQHLAAEQSGAATAALGNKEDESKAAPVAS